MNGASGGREVLRTLTRRSLYGGLEERRRGYLRFQALIRKYAQQRNEVIQETLSLPLHGGIRQRHRLSRREMGERPGFTSGLTSGDPAVILLGSGREVL